MNNTFSRLAVVLTGALLTFIAVPETAYAYGGPGSVVSAIGTLLAVVAALFASVLGFLWFPIKRLYKRLTKKQVEQQVETEGE